MKLHGQKMAWGKIIHMYTLTYIHIHIHLYTYFNLFLFALPLCRLFSIKSQMISYDKKLDGLDVRLHTEDFFSRKHIE